MTPSRAGRLFLLLLAASFFLLRFVHLTADFPHAIRWDDGIATDEGWYASSAINAHTWGTGLLPGDMNISVLMPVWPLIARAAFAVGGFHVNSLRAAAVLFFLLDVALLCAILRRYGAATWVPLFLVLAAVNPWSFVFSRSAFLEFPMLAFVLLAILVAFTAGPVRETLDARATLRLLASGIIFAVALLLKTTAVALLPVLLYIVLQPAPPQAPWPTWSRGLRLTPVFCGICLLYVPYWLVHIRPHAVDVNFYLSVVKNTLRLTPLGFAADASRPFRYGLGSDHLLFSLALLVVPLSVLVPRLRTLWRDPLYTFAAVWLISFLGFMVKHNNDPARYFAVVIPALFLTVIALLRNTNWSSPAVRHALLALLIVDVTVNTLQTTMIVTHPQYSFKHAATEIGRIIQNEPGASNVVIGDDAYEVALQSPLKPINLLFHSASITSQMQQRHPQWWLQFSPIEDGRCFRDVLSAAYTADRRGEWDIFYPGQKLTLWKLSPIAGKSLPATLTPGQTAACSPPIYN